MGLRVSPAAPAVASCLVALALGLAGGARAGEIAFLHVEGNVGGASGGHAALRLDGRVYHWQHGDDDVFHLVREPWDGFLVGYGTLKNRPIHVARVEADDGDVARLRDHLIGEYLAQKRVLAERAASEQDLALARALGGLGAGPELAGLGLFAETGSSQRVLTSGGSDALEAAIERADRAIEEHVGRVASAPAAAELGPLREAIVWRHALGVVADGRPLDPTALMRPGGEALGRAERERLAALASRLRGRVVALLESSRPDRAETLLLATARSLAIEASLAEGRFVLLDAFPSHATRFEAYREELEALSSMAHVLFAAVRERVFEQELDESGYNALEDLASREVEARRASQSEGTELRGTRTRLLPSRSRAVLPALRLDPDVAAVLEERAQARWAAIAQQATERWGYDLVRENCATELDVALEQAFGSRDELRRALGGALEPGTGLGFIPYVWLARVRGNLRVASEEHWPNHRASAVSERLLQAPGVLTHLRESNAFTSRVYRRRDQDGTFVFFTDHTVAWRPLLGAVNVAAGLADGLLGLGTLPFDRGRRIERAAKGVVFSAPEIVFWNIRKGTFDARTLPGLADRLLAGAPAPPEA